MPGRHANAGFVDLDPVFFRKALCYSFGDVEVRSQVIGGKALCRLNQPSRVPHKHWLIIRLDAPELIEHALNLCEPTGGVRPGIPNANAQQLEAPYDI